MEKHPCVPGSSGILKIILTATCVYLVLCISFWPVRVLEIAHAEADGRVFWKSVKSGDRFSLGYVHSVQLSRVTDDFEIDQDCGIALVSTAFSDHGAGLPYNLDRGGFFSVQNDGEFRISGMRVPLPEIPLRVGREYDNTFSFGSCNINLSEVCGDALLTVRTRRLPFFRYLLWRVIGLMLPWLETQSLA